jgi:hypothetical protein
MALASTLKASRYRSDMAGAGPCPTRFILSARSATVIQFRFYHHPGQGDHGSSLKNAARNRGVLFLLLLQQHANIGTTNHEEAAVRKPS